MYGWGEERKNACMEILSVGGSRIYERTSKTKEEFEEVHYWEKWWSRLGRKEASGSPFPAERSLSNEH